MPISHIEKQKTKLIKLEYSEISVVRISSGKITRQFWLKNISLKAQEWYFRWINNFNNALPDVPLHKRTKEDLQAYVDLLIRQNKYQNWQLVQVNDALRLLYQEYLTLPWARPWPVVLENMRHADTLKQDHTSRKTVNFKDIPNWDGVEIRIPGLLEKVKTVLRTLHYSYRTEQSYLEWICRFFNFNGLKDPSELGTTEVRRYLEYLATEREVAGSTQRQALNALVFLYTKILDKPLDEIGPYERPKKPARLPVVLTRDETARVLQEMTGVHAMMAGLLYGAGLRLMECVRLRVKDIDFEKHQLVVRDGKGNKDRVTVLPEKYEKMLKEHLVEIKTYHEQYLRQGYGAVYIWPSLERKYPNIAKEWGWQYVFPAKDLSVDPRSGQVRRHHINERSLQRAFKDAVHRAGMTKQAGCHTLRHYGKCLFMGSVFPKIPVFQDFCKNTSHNIFCYLHRFCNQFIKSSSFSHDGISPVFNSRYALSNAFRFISLSARA